jgi:hypothetical protein
MTLINCITPKNTLQKKIRLGPKGDGGYVVTEKMLSECSCLFNYGVGNEIGFEKDFVEKYEKLVYMFDHTIPDFDFSKINNKLNFLREGLGFEENCKDFLLHSDDLGIKEKIILKIDIEGKEFDYFENTNIDELSNRCVGILLEVHQLSNPNLKERFINFSKKILEKFYICHVHGNNWGGTFVEDGEEIPNVIELTYIHKSLVNELSDEKEKYPIDGLDFKNSHYYSEIELKYIK